MHVCVLCQTRLVMHTQTRSSRSRGRHGLHRHARRRARRRRRRGLLHDGDGRLRGGGHRPELRRAGALLRLPADRELRRRRGAARVGARAVRGSRHARTPAPAWPPGWRDGGSSRSTTSTRARSSAGSARTASLRCALGEAAPDELLARALAEPPIDGRPLDRRVGTPEPYTVGAGPRVALVDLGCKRSIPGGSPRPGSRCSSCPGDWDADAILETSAARRAGRQRPGRPGRPRRPDRGGPRPARPRAAVRHLPRPPAPRARARPARRSSSRSATAARTTRCATCATGRVLVTVQNHGFAVSRRRRRPGHATSR